MGMFTLGNGRMIRLMEKALTFLSVEPNMWESGLMTNKMEMEKKLGPIKLFTLGNTRMGKSMVRANSCGLTTAHIMETFSKTTYTGSENTNGKMEGPTKVNG